MSAVLFHFLTGEYAAGLAVHDALHAPTGDDHRWAGACALNLHQTARAKTLFFRARAAGAAGATVGLATVYRVTSDHTLVRHSLASVQPSDLAPIDRALYWRETGLLRMLDDDLTGASEALEHAWACTFEDELAGHVSGVVAQSAAFLYGLRGLDVQAEQFLDEASEQANPAMRAYVLSARGLRRGYLGRFDEAHEDFTAAWVDAEKIPAIRAVLTYNTGLLAWLKGDPEAVPLLTQAASTAREGAERETEGYARLALSAAHLSAGHLSDARTELARAQALTVTPHLEHLQALRTAALQYHDDPAAAIVTLQDCAAAFHRSHRTREWAWTQLHLAEAHLRQGDPVSADQALTAAADACHAMQAGASLTAELQGLPYVRGRLTGQGAEHYTRVLLGPEYSAEHAPPDVRLVTLGEARLYVNGQPLTTEYARAAEILAYLLRHPGRTLERIITDLFDGDPKRSRNYVHQVRYALMKAVPGLSIPASSQRTYDVRWTGVSVHWDVQDLEAALAEGTAQGVQRAAALYTGTFLPDADNDWAARERHDLTWKLVQAGLTQLEAWLNTGEYALCLPLAERLLDVDPYNESLNAVMVRVVRILNGDTKARHTISRLAQHFEHELGEVPPALRALRHELSELN